jgi:hypothetical protein
MNGRRLQIPLGCLRQKEYTMRKPFFAIMDLTLYG